jgi:hypothetical protein
MCSVRKLALMTASLFIFNRRKPIFPRNFKNEANPSFYSGLSDDGPIPLKMPSTPHRWGQDGLSSFWEAGRNNQFGTFVKKRPIFDKLVGIDNAFTAVSKKWYKERAQSVPLNRL